MANLKFIDCSPRMRRAQELLEQGLTVFVEGYIQDRWDGEVVLLLLPEKLVWVEMEPSASTFGVVGKDGRFLPTLSTRLYRADFSPV